MRYITATIGAIFIFVGVGIVCLLVGGFLPREFNHKIIKIPIGPIFFVKTNPTMLFAIPVAGFAAFHSYRSTLKRYAKPADDNSLSAH